MSETTPYELWVQSGQDGDRYRALLREYGLLLMPGDEGYEESSRNLPCGWPGPQPGRIVRDTWVKWAREQPDPKDSWLVPWEDLDDGQREVDARIEAAVRADERERTRQWLNAEGRKLQRLADSADPHGPAARRTARNQREMAASMFNAAARLREVAGD